MSSSEALSPVPHTFLLRRARSISDSRSVREQTRQTRSILTENLLRDAATSLTSHQLPSRSRLSVSARNQSRSTEKIRSAVSSRGGPVESVMGVWGGYEAGMCVRRRL